MRIVRLIDGRVNVALSAGEFEALTYLVTLGKASAAPRPANLSAAIHTALDVTFGPDDCLKPDEDWRKR